MVAFTVPSDARNGRICNVLRPISDLSLDGTTDDPAPSFRDELLPHLVHWLHAVRTRVRKDVVCSFPPLVRRARVRFTSPRAPRCWRVGVPWAGGVARLLAGAVSALVSFGRGARRARVTRGEQSLLGRVGGVRTPASRDSAGGRS